MLYTWSPFPPTCPGFESTTDYSRPRSPNNSWVISLNREQTLSYCDGSLAVRIRAHFLISFEVPATTAQSIHLLMRRSWTFASVPSAVRIGQERWLR